MNTLMNWLSFATLVYIVGVKAKWWNGPLSALRNYRHRQALSDTDTDTTNRRSDTTDTPDRDDGDMSVSVSDEGPSREVAPGVFVSQDSRVRAVRVTPPHRTWGWGPRPLDDLRAEMRTDSKPDSTPGPAPDAPSTSPASRRRWVRDQLTAGRRPAAIVADGAAKWGCVERTIERDIAHIQRAARSRRDTR